MVDYYRTALCGHPVNFLLRYGLINIYIYDEVECRDDKDLPNGINLFLANLFKKKFKGDPVEFQLYRMLAHMMH